MAASLLFGTSPEAQWLVRECSVLARCERPVLIVGETGTGKTTLAKYIHQLSGRPGEFIAEPAAGLPDSLVHSALAGHSKGAFTGASAPQVGLLEAAHNGTFFLDDLDAASPLLQSILLRLLDHGTLRRVGEVRSRELNVRFLAATNADLEANVAAKSFRHDILPRFGPFLLPLRPLRERRDEILPLARHFLAAEAQELEWEDVPSFDDQVADAFSSAPWRDNIRGLESVCTWIVLHLKPGERITMAGLPPTFEATLHPSKRGASRRVTPERIREAIVVADGNKSAAARSLNISRMHLHRVLKNDRGDAPAQAAQL
jgi:DNA-binding NtrC family response regulator